MATQLGRLTLGVDPGLAATGYAILRDPPEVLACGTIKTAAGRSSGQRLLQIQRDLERLLDATPVQEAALEEVFMGSNRTSVVGVAQARGVVLALLESRGVAVHEYKPAQVKITMTGYGMAGKAQMARMLAVQLRVDPAPGSDHAVDAIAIAVCHLRSRRMRMVATGGSPGGRALPGPGEGGIPPSN